MQVVAEFHGVMVLDAPHLSPGILKAINEGLYERPEIEGALVNLRPGDRVVELGSGAGIVSAVLAKNIADVQIRTFEANPNLIAHIEKLHAHNGVAGSVQVVNAIVTTDVTAGTTTPFNISNNFLGSRIADEVDCSSSKQCLVDTIPYTDLKASFPHNVLVMDIEGAERDFLAHADLDGIDFVIVELHPATYGQEGVTSCIAALKAHGLMLDPASSSLAVKVFKSAQRMALGLNRSLVDWPDIPARFDIDPATPLSRPALCLTGAVLAHNAGPDDSAIAAAVFDAAQREVPAAICWHDSQTRLMTGRHYPRPKRIVDLPGRWLFGGCVDVTSPWALAQIFSRVWYLLHRQEPCDGVLYFPLGCAPQDTATAQITSALSRAGLEIEVKLISVFLRPEALIVPPQAAVAGDVAKGHPEMRDAVRKALGVARVTRAKGKILLCNGSDELRHLEALGVAIVDLAQLPLVDVLDAIAKAGMVCVAGDGLYDVVQYAACKDAKLALALDHDDADAVGAHLNAVGFKVIGHCDLAELLDVTKAQAALSRAGLL